MNGREAKKIRREARRQLRAQTSVRLRWFARPRIFRLWAVPATVAVSLVARLGWRSIARRWERFIRSVPKRGTFRVVET